MTSSDEPAVQIPLPPPIQPSIHPSPSPIQPSIHPSPLFQQPNPLHRTSSFDSTNESNPFYLHYAENPGVILVSQPLLGTPNYSIWNRSMTMAFTIKNKLGFVDGSIPKPDPDHDSYYPWISWLFNAISKEIADSVMYNDSASHIWRDLRVRFTQSNGPRLFHSRKNFAKLTQESSSVSTYFTKLKMHWDELQAFCPLDACICGSECKATKSILAGQEREFILQFLMGLDEKFNHIRGQILLYDPLPEINKIFSLIIQEEEQLGLSIAEPVSSAVMAVKSAARSVGAKSGSKPVCTHCGKTGHTVEKCYRLHGFPPGFKFTKNKIMSSAQTVSVDQDQNSLPGLSNIKEHCQTLISSLQNQSLLTSTAPSVNQVSVSPNHSSLVPNFSGDSFMPSVFSSTSSCHITHCQDQPTSWILDTGATDHIVGSLHLLTNIISTEPIKIRLPNNHFVFATHIGTAVINSVLTLTNVLYIPQFSVNLISASRLTSDLSCCLIFLNHHCYIKDHIQWKTIGVAKLFGGLYHLLQTPGASFDSRQSASLLSCNLSSHKSSFLWHCRLGHPSNSRLQLIKSALPISSSHPLQTPSHCSVCHLSKQKKLPFPNSTSQTQHPFQLIHCDIWGPFPVISYDGYRYFLTIVDDYSRCTWIHLLKTKSEARHHLQNFCHMVETQFNTSVKILRSDQGLEFNRNDFFNHKGILHQRSCVYTPQQNSIVERKHQHILNVARSLRFQAHLPIYFWSDCILTATHIINRLPTPLLHNTSPFEVLFKQPPTYDLF